MLEVSNATTRGQQVEKAVAILLSDHPNVESVVEQVFEEEVDEFSNIDLVVTTKDGRTVYVFALVIFGWGHHNKIALQIVGKVQRWAV